MKKIFSHFWLLLLVFAILAGLARAVALYENTALDEAVQAIGRTSYSSVPFPAVVRTMSLFRLLGLLACLVSAGVVFFRSGPTARRGLAGFSAFLLASVPHANQLGAATAAPFPDPWAGWLKGAWELLGAAGLLGVMVGFFILPAGLPKGRMRRVAIACLAVLVIALIIMISGVFGEEAWLVIVVAMLITLVAGISWQVYLFWNPGHAGQPRQVRWVSLALVLVGLWILLSNLFLGRLAVQNGAWLFLDILLGILIMVFLGLTLARAVLELGMWGSDPVPARRLLLAFGLMGLLALANLGWMGASALKRGPTAPQQALAPLSPGQKRGVVIDTDMGADDWMAILYLLRRPEVQVKAITVSGTGLSHCAPGVENALRLVALAESEPIPVACGQTTPLQGFHYFPGGWRSGSDRFTHPAPEPAANPADGEDAVTVLNQAIHSASQPAVLLALGPLTNLAKALQNDPGLKDRIEMVFIMGGAVDTTGNLIEGGVDNAWGEWNIYIDPLAAQIVLDSGVPITLVALDATNHVPATRAFVTRLANMAATPSTEFVARVLEANPGLDALFGYYFWDPLAAGLLSDESLGRYQERRLQVVTEEGYQNGRLVEDRSGAPVRLAVWADRQRFEQALIDTYSAK